MNFFIRCWETNNIHREANTTSAICKRIEIFSFHVYISHFLSHSHQLSKKKKSLFCPLRLLPSSRSPSAHLCMRHIRDCVDSYIKSQRNIDENERWSVCIASVNVSIAFALVIFPHRLNKPNYIYKHDAIKMHDAILRIYRAAGERSQH